MATAPSEPSADTLSLISMQLRQGTARAHEDAESSHFVAWLMDGTLSAAAYADHTAQLWCVYSALESAVRAGRGLPEVQAIYDSRLERKEKLEHDLAQQWGQDWEQQVTMLEGTSKYVDRLRELEANPSGPELVAHHYVRYLGDLAGGQVIARRVSEHYGVQAAALNFHDFSELGKIKPFRDRYKAGLDGLELDSAQQESMMSEAVAAFSHNQAVFESLSELHKP